MDARKIIDHAAWHNANPDYARAGYPKVQTYRAEVGRSGRADDVVYFNVEEGTDPGTRLRQINLFARYRSTRISLAGVEG
jgi:hypothetical protein